MTLKKKSHELKNRGLHNIKQKAVFRQMRIARKSAKICGKKASRVCKNGRMALGVEEQNQSWGW